MRVNITPLGIEMILHCLQGGAPIVFTSMVLGNGADAGTNASALNAPLLNISISELVREADSDFVKLTGVFSNADVSDRFNATELGVMAQAGDEENPLLFAYGYTQESEATIIPAAADYAFEMTQNVFVYVGATQDVSAVISDSVATVSRAQFTQHTNDNRNPHKVNAEQVGLGNVPNVTTDDQTPTVKYFDWKYSGLSSDFSNIDIATLYPQDGETLQNLLKKLCSIAKLALVHIASAKNPHAITYSGIGASPSSHGHTASNIVSGVLPVGRGGTGVQSAAALAEKLKTYLAEPVFGVYDGDGTTKRLIELPFTPSAVLVANDIGMFGDDVQGTCGGVAVGSAGAAGYGCSSTYAETWSDSYTALMITTNGFYVNYSSANKVRTNTSGKSYRYIAWR